MYSPPPLCCKIAILKRIGEDSSPCVSCGEIGIHSIEPYRKEIFLTSAILSLISLIMTLYSTLALSSDVDVVKATHWAKADLKSEFGDGTIFFGLRGVVVDFSEPEFIDFGKGNCMTDYCNDCKDASVSFQSSVIISAVTCIPQILTDVSRSTRRGDLRFLKFMGIFTGLLGFSLTVSSLAQYREVCVQNANDELSEYEVSLGVGFIMLFVPAALKLVDAVLHLIVPVPQKLSDMELHRLDN